MKRKESHISAGALRQKHALSLQERNVILVTNDFAAGHLQGATSGQIVLETRGIFRTQMPLKSLMHPQVENYDLYS